MTLSSKQKTYELLQHYYAAFNRGDSAAMLDAVSDDVCHDVNQGERRIGKEAFKTFNAHMDKCYSEQLENIIIMVSDDGAHAAAEFIVNGIYKSSDDGLPPAKGQKYRLPAGTFLEIKNNKITRITTYYNLQNWIAQVSV